MRPFIQNQDPTVVIQIKAVLKMAKGTMMR